MRASLARTRSQRNVISQMKYLGPGQVVELKVGERRMKIVKGLFSIVLVFVISISVYSSVLSFYSVEIDLTSTVTYIVDGDTFDITSGDRIRLADIDCPERGDSGFYEATDALSDLIYGKTVYLDIDDVYVYDTLGSRLVCLVYVEYG